MKNDGTFPVKDQPSHQLVVSAGFLLLALMCTLVVLPWSGFKAGKKYAIFLWVLYTVYLTTALTLEFTVKDKDED